MVGEIYWNVTIWPDLSHTPRRTGNTSDAMTAETAWGSFGFGFCNSWSLPVITDLCIVGVLFISFGLGMCGVSLRWRWYDCVWHKNGVQKGDRLRDGRAGGTVFFRWVERQKSRILDSFSHSSMVQWKKWHSIWKVAAIEGTCFFAESWLWEEGYVYRASFLLLKRTHGFPKEVKWQDLIIPFLSSSGFGEKRSPSDRIMFGILRAHTEIPRNEFGNYKQNKWSCHNIEIDTNKEMNHDGYRK